MNSKKDFSSVDIEINEDLKPVTSLYNHDSRSINNSEFQSKTFAVLSITTEKNNKQYIEELSCQKKFTNLFCIDIFHWYTQSKVKREMTNFFMHWNQVCLFYILGIIVGITFTTLYFQLGVFYSDWLLSNLDEEKFNVNVDVKFNDFYHSKEDLLIKHFSTLFNNSNVKFLSNRKSTSEIFQENFSRKTRIYVGVITAKKYLNSRALAVNNTWGSQVDGIEFYTQFGSREEFHVPVVNLKDVSDTEYPPQKKAFQTLKHMCSHHLDSYDWFIRADDDVYIRVKRLKKFLSTFDSNRKIYMGQAGHGLPGVKDTLGLNGSNFCMGGPGVIFSRRALEELCPHLDTCMKDVVTVEEDVEIGRCVTRHLEIECTHAWETLKLFHHAYQEEYSEEKPFLGNLAENQHVEDAITLHYLKISSIMYKMHRHYSNAMVNEIEQKLLGLQENIKAILSALPPDAASKPEFSMSQPNKFKYYETWKSFNTEAIFSLSPSNVINDITNDVLADLKRVGENAMDDSIREKKDNNLQFGHVIDGYLRSDYNRGTDYFVDVRFESKFQNISHQEKRVHAFRHVGNLQLSSTSLLNMADSKIQFTIIATVPSRKLSELELYIQNFFDLFNKDIQFPVHLFIASLDNSDVKINNQTVMTTIEDIVERYRVKHPGKKLSCLPHFEKNFVDKFSSIDLTYMRGIFHSYKILNNSKAVALLTSTDVTLTVELLKTCQKMTKPASSKFVWKRKQFKNSFSPSAQIYQPVQLYYDFSRNSINVTSTNNILNVFQTENQNYFPPLCGHINQLYSVLRSAILEKSNGFQKTLLRKVYEGKLSLVRAPARQYFKYLNK